MKGSNNNETTIILNTTIQYYNNNKLIIALRILKILQIQSALQNEKQMHLRVSYLM